MAFPNPFSAYTRIGFMSAASLNIYDLSGRCVRTLSGSSSVVFDGRDNRGALLPSGVYQCRLISGKRVLSTRLVLAR